MHAAHTAQHKTSPHGARRTADAVRKRAVWLGVVALLLVAAQTARAQGPQPFGVVLSVPSPLVAELKALNEAPLSYVVTPLHTAPAMVDFFNLPVTTVRIVPADLGAQPLKATLPCRLPRAALKAVQQINNNTPIIELNPGGDAHVATVEIVVSHQSALLEQTRFLMVPIRFMSIFLQQNPRKNVRLVHITQANNIEWVALLAIDQKDATGLAVPVTLFGLDLLRALVLLNSNIAVGPTGTFDGVLVTTFSVN